jgi:hypothetical protein
VRGLHKAEEPLRALWKRRYGNKEGRRYVVDGCLCQTWRSDPFTMSIFCYRSPGICKGRNELNRTWRGRSACSSSVVPGLGPNSLDGYVALATRLGRLAD